MTWIRKWIIEIMTVVLLGGTLLSMSFAQQPPQSCEEARDALNVQVVILQNSRTRTEADLAQIAAALQKAQARITDLEKQIPKPAEKKAEKEPKK